MPLSVPSSPQFHPNTTPDAHCVEAPCVVFSAPLPGAMRKRCCDATLVDRGNCQARLGVGSKREFVCYVELSRGPSGTLYIWTAQIGGRWARRAPPALRASAARRVGRSTPSAVERRDPGPCRCYWLTAAEMKSVF